MKPYINPYRIGASIIFNRLKYDLSLKSIKSFKKLSKLKDTHLNEKCVIMCNGPSLNYVDFELLKESRVFTFGLNKINLLFSKVDFRPNAIVSVNPYVIEQNLDFFSKTDIPLFLDYSAINSIGLNIDLIRNNSNVHFLSSVDSIGRFAKDVSLGICQGYTVTYVAMQIAYHLGFSKVTLVGCDHSFATKGMANKEVKLDVDDNNHFDPNYFSKADRWQLPDLLGSEFHYQIARDEFNNDGRMIYNSTVGGKLELFERITLNEFLAM